MARQLRIEYAGAIYHVMNRGDRREPIFMDDGDRQRFVETLAAAGVKILWQVHAYVPLNSARAKLVAADQLVQGFTWSRGPAYLRAPSKRPAWLQVDRLVGESGIPQDSPAARAEPIIAAELTRRRCPAAELKVRPKGDAAKVAVAERLRAETARTVGWIAERLWMGIHAHLNHLLYRRRKSSHE